MDNLIELQTRCVAHEIRNHVSICDMYSEIIKKHLQRSNYQNESVDNALECIKKSLKIISTTLLDLKLINNLESKICDLEYLIKESTRLSTAYTSGKDINIDYTVENTAKIYVDENKFIACIVNIIKNGIEAIDTKGKIEIIATIKEKQAYIKITNNGKMIPPETQAVIFKQGFTTKQSGSGLGLHICKTQLELQNATLKLNTSNNDYTEFEICIPIN